MKPTLFASRIAEKSNETGGRVMLDTPLKSGKTIKPVRLFGTIRVVPQSANQPPKRELLAQRRRKDDPPAIAFGWWMLPCGMIGAALWILMVL